MKQTTKSPKHTDSEKSQKFANQTNKQGYSIENNEKETTNNQIIEIIEIKNTPFTAIKENNQWFLTMGKYRLSNNVESLKKCKKIIKKDPWSITMALILIITKEQTEKPII